jgi:large subunit ribosomal protein L1
MDKQQVTEALKVVKEGSSKRNFKQSYDLIINLKGMDMKNPEHQLNIFPLMHYSRGKKVKVCGLVGPELQDESKKYFDETLTVDQFSQYQDKKKAKKLAAAYDYFVAQATIMPKVATAFGKVFGPRARMPNPKVGCVVPPNALLKPLYEKLQKTVRLRAITDPLVMCSIGTEEMKDEEIIDNILTVYNAVMHAVPNEKNSIKNVVLKLTMGKPVKIGAKEEEQVDTKKKVTKKEVPKVKKRS